MAEVEAFTVVRRAFRRHTLALADGAAHPMLSPGKVYRVQTVTWPKRGDDYVPEPQGIRVHLRLEGLPRQATPVLLSLPMGEVLDMLRQGAVQAM